jgi:uncharacterized protein (TIGR02271 family)
MARKTRNSPAHTSSELWTYRDPGYSDITGFDVEATDGSIGSVDEAASDDGNSYIVVDTGPWIFGKKVVIPAGMVQRVDSADRRVWVALTKDQIENAPEFDELHYQDADYRTSMADYYADHTGDWEGDVLERREERLTVDKDTEQIGSVRVGKRVVEETQSVDVPVKREELIIERRSVDRPADDTSLTEESVDIPVYGEKVRTGKHARVVEELEVGKTAKTDTQRVTDTVRREEFDVDVDEDTTPR